MLVATPEMTVRIPPDPAEPSVRDRGENLEGSPVRPVGGAGRFWRSWIFPIRIRVLVRSGLRCARQASTRATGRSGGPDGPEARRPWATRRRASWTRSARALRTRPSAIGCSASPPRRAQAELAVLSCYAPVPSSLGFQGAAALQAAIETATRRSASSAPEAAARCSSTARPEASAAPRCSSPWCAGRG